MVALVRSGQRVSSAAPRRLPTTRGNPVHLGIGMSNIVDIVRRRSATESPKVFEQRRALNKALTTAWENIVNDVVPIGQRAEHIRKARLEAFSMAIVNADESTLDIFAENDGSYSVEMLTLWTRQNPDVMRTICGEHANKVLPS